MNSWRWIYKFKTADGLGGEAKYFSDTPHEYMRPCKPRFYAAAIQYQTEPDPTLQSQCRVYRLRKREVWSAKKQIGLAFYEEE